MAVSSNPSTTLTSRILLGVTIAVNLGAAVAATPSLGARSEAPAVPAPIEKAAFGDSATALRPFGEGPAILVGRAYGADDEDCVLAVTRVEGSDGQVSVARGIACPQ
ncbi:hypothetical protein IY145_06605 [Methylosinus sp. H3A]|uniref:hypothetical protein n=1 Tax=Methylosinus sp. H3A TaxID=2785786 RepID=UPI0018C222B3|nr:hypothetical protein [Methylosinus sp. H3A]MBG0809043.1 hypothetical protein [Methylosinus sp. H3A]